MKKTLFATAGLLLFTLCACNNKQNKTESAVDSTKTADVAVVTAEAAVINPLEGYESSEMPELGLKAWIENGKVLFKVDKEKYSKATDNYDFVRMGYQEPCEVYVPEPAIGVCLAQHIDGIENNGLYIIGASKHLYLYDMREGIAGIILAAGIVPFVEDCVKINAFCEDDAYYVEAINEKDEIMEPIFWGYREENGPRQVSFTLGDDEYMLSMETNWTCSLRKFGTDTNLHGHFVEVGDMAPVWELEFDSNEVYSETGSPYKPISPVKLTVEYDRNAEKIKFSQNSLELPANKWLQVEVIPLYD